MTTTALALRGTELDRYFAEVSRYPLLSREEEQRLARLYRDEGDVKAAHQLVVSNLRFVVKIAHQYKGYGFKLLDLVQEGNLGLMHAVKKFDPDRGYRLISYAVWWIKAQIQAFILQSWSLVKLGTGRIQRRLFFKLRSERADMEQQAFGDNEAARDGLAERLGIDRGELAEMELRLAARDFSLDAPLGQADDGSVSATHLDMLQDHNDDPETQAVSRQEHRILDAVLAQGTSDLDPRETVILNRRLLADEPETLADIGKEFGVSRERARQIEERLVKKLQAVRATVEAELSA